MVFAQPFLFTADVETRKDVRSLLMDFAKHLSKQLNVEQKECTSKVRKYFNRKCRPQLMTPCRLFRSEKMDEIREKSKGDFFAMNNIRTEMWNAVKADKELLADYTTRANAFNVEHKLNVKKTKRRTGYLTFNMETRPNVATEFPDLSLGEISKKIGKMWRELSDEERSEWNSKAKMVEDSSSSSSATTTDVKPETKESKKKTKTSKTKTSKTKTKSTKTKKTRKSKKDVDTVTNETV